MITCRFYKKNHKNKINDFIIEVLSNKKCLGIFGLIYNDLKIDFRKFIYLSFKNPQTVSFLLSDTKDYYLYGLTEYSSEDIFIKDIEIKNDMLNLFIDNLLQVKNKFYEELKTIFITYNDLHDIKNQIDIIIDKFINHINKSDIILFDDKRFKPVTDSYIANLHLEEAEEIHKFILSCKKNNESDIFKASSGNVYKFNNLNKELHYIKCNNHKKIYRDTIKLARIIDDKGIKLVKNNLYHFSPNHENPDYFIINDINIHKNRIEFVDVYTTPPQS